MNLNSDIALRVVVDSGAVAWTDSPEPGVQRRALARDGGEVARATSVVRYAPGARFARHRHDLGEEFLVLDGEFCDEHGVYGRGTYVKNPPGSSHSPWSTTGCTIFVKLRHLDPADRQRIVVSGNQLQWLPGSVPGLSVVPLSSFGSQHTALVRWRAGTRFHAHRHDGGEEIFVVSGVFEDEHGRYPAGTWIRSPHMSLHEPYSREGCTILVKTGHLRDANVELREVS
ncbi:MAG TPA: cupin domain-containing protein [Steroidobacteraceae bacterium]|nr:cupin domain-containing protein [Steroidobacteraceae bacterium]